MFSNNAFLSRGYCILKTHQSLNYLFESYGTSRRKACETLTNNLHKIVIRQEVASLLAQELDNNNSQQDQNSFIQHLSQNETYAKQSSQQLLLLLEENFQKATQLLSLLMNFYVNHRGPLTTDTTIRLLNALAQVDYINLHWWEMNPISGDISPLISQNHHNIETQQSSLCMQHVDIIVDKEKHTAHQIILFGVENRQSIEIAIPPLKTQQANYKPSTSIKPILTQLNLHKDRRKVPLQQNSSPESPIEAEDTLIHPYLKSLIEKHDGLVMLNHEAQAHFRLPIDKLYVALTVDTTAHSERYTYIDELNQHLQMQWHYEKLFPANIDYKLKHYCQHLEQEQSASLTTIDWDSLLLAPNLLSPAEQTTAFTFLDSVVHEFDIMKRSQKEIQHEKKQLNLAQAYSHFTHMVILGDPGNGKSTLARWLSVNMAKAYLAHAQRLEVPKYQVDPTIEQKNTTNIAIGQTVRIPIFITIAEYAQFCEQHSDDFSLDSFIHDKYPNDSSALNFFLAQGKCLIILDGFDEIAQRENRHTITNNIHVFLDKWFIERQNELNTSTVSREIDCGNRFLITSRIAGNYTSILREDFIRVTIEPLDQKMVNLFFHRWFDALSSATNNSKQPKKYATFLSRRVSNDPYLNTLVKTPQLATVVAHVYVSQNYQLPQSKVSLYQSAVENFTTSWRNRLNTNSTRYQHFTKEFIEQLLQDLAYEAHFRSGPINELLIRNVFTRQINKLNFTRQQAQHHVKSLLSLITDEVGLIIPHGVNTYQFIHRQFQEYLAARNILSKFDDPVKTSALFTQLLHDINWHEPLRLALDCLCQESPEMWITLIHKILDDTNNLDTALPLTSYMLIDLLSTANYELLHNNIGEKPLQSLLEKLIFSITQAYITQHKNNCQAMMEHTYICLAKIVATEFQPVFVQACVALFSNETIAAALARLLIDAQYSNQQFISPLESLLRKKLLIQHNNATSDLLQKHIELTNEGRQQTTLTQGIDTLLNSSWIKQPNHYSALITCAPAFENKHSVNSFKTYINKANFLSLPKETSSPMLNSLEYDWGDDAIYNIAVFLDTRGEKNYQLWDKPVLYSPKYFSLNNDTISIMLQEYQSGISTIALAEKIEQHYIQSDSITEKTTALTTLVALDYPSEHLVKLTNETKQSFIDHLVYLQGKFKHITYCAHYSLVDILRKINTQTQNVNYNMMWSSFLDFFTQTTELYFACPPILSNNPGSQIGLLSYTFFIKLTDKIGNSHKCFSEDITSIILDFMRCNAIPYLHIFNYLPLVNLCSIGGYHWSVDKLPIYAWRSNPISEDDIPWQILTLIIRLPRSLRVIHRALATHLFSKYLQKYPDLFAEIIIITKVLFQGQPKKQVDLAHILKQGFNIQQNWLENTIQSINTITSPYYQARAWLRLATSQGNQKNTFFNNALAVIPQIVDIEKRAELEMLAAENCALALPKEEAMHTRTSLVDQALTTIRHLPHSGQKALLLTRCALLQGTYDSLMLESLECLHFIQDEQHRAEHARLLYPLIKIINNPDITAKANHLYQQFSDSQYACYAAGKNSMFVEQLIKLLIDEQPESQNTWIPFITASRLQDCLEQFNASTTAEQKWLNFLKAPSIDNAESLIRQTEGNSLDFSLTAAVAIDQIQQQATIPQLERIFKLLLPMLRNASGETLPILTRWLLSNQNSQLQKLLANTALVLICEMHDSFYPSHFSDTVSLLSSPFDSWRHRISYLFRVNSKFKYPFTHAVSIMGKESYYNLVKHLHETSGHDRQTFYILYSAGVELYQDDPELARSLVLQLDTADNDDHRSIAELGLTNNAYGSTEVINILIDYFAQTNSNTQKIILKTLGFYTITDPKVTHQDIKSLNDKTWARFTEVFKSTDLSQVNTTDLCQDSLEIQCDHLVDLLKTKLNSAELDFTALEHSWREKCQVDLSKLQKMSTSEIARALSDIYYINYTVSTDLDTEKRAFQIIAKRIMDYKIPVDAILQLLTQALSSFFEQTEQDTPDALCIILFGITNQLANYFPWQLRHQLEQIIQYTFPTLPSRLLKLMQTQKSTLLRNILLDFFEYIPASEYTLEAICIGLTHTEQTLVSATNVAKKITFNHQINYQLVDRLMILLESDSAIAADFAIEILVKIALSELTKPEIRQEIMYRLAVAFKRVESQGFIIMTLFPTSVADIPNLTSQILKGMMKIAQLPDYSFDHKKQAQRLYDEANITAIKEGDELALAQYLQQHPQTSWEDPAVVAAIKYMDDTQDINMLRILLTSRALTEQYGKIIEIATKSPNLLLLQQLQEQTPQPYLAFDIKYGILAFAIKQSNFALCKFLLKQGSSVNQKNIAGITAFETLFIEHFKFYDSSILQLLLCHQPDIINEISEKYLLSNRTSMTKEELLRASEARFIINIYRKCQQHSSHKKQLLIMAAKNNYLHIVEELFSQGLPTECSDDEENNLLLIAIKNNYETFAEKLIELGADVNKQNAKGETPILLAIKAQMINLSSLLIETGNLNINVMDSEGNTVLFYAASEGYSDLCRLILENQGDANQANLLNGLPLHMASWRGHLSCVKQLLSKTNDINTYVDNEATPLHLAILSGSSLEIIKLLIDNGADLNQKMRGISIGTLAYIRDKTSHINYFNSIGIKENTDDVPHISPSYFIVADPARETLLIGLDRLGVELSSPGCNGETWLNYALKNKRDNVAKILLKLLVDPRILNHKGEMAINIAREHNLCAGEIVRLINDRVTELNTGTALTISSITPVQQLSQTGIFSQHGQASSSSMINRHAASFK